jgi:hypothetical protein
MPVTCSGSAAARAAGRRSEANPEIAVRHQTNGGHDQLIANDQAASVQCCAVSLGAQACDQPVAGDRHAEREQRDKVGRGG